jgi:hypothetical protein
MHLSIDLKMSQGVVIGHSRWSGEMGKVGVISVKCDDGEEGPMALGPR